jgi:hypothetical protein
LGVEIAIDDIVIDAPRSPHRERAEAEPQQQIEPRDRPARQCDRPGARPEEQPRADRPIEAREQRIGAQTLR